MHKISEPELREFDNEGAISATKVVRTDDGYVVVINVNWKDGDLVVYSQRDRPRVWQSMDTLIGFLGRAAPSINHFEVFLTEGDET